MTKTPPTHQISGAAVEKVSFGYEIKLRGAVM
jgi:hypothetical protein